MAKQPKPKPCPWCASTLPPAQKLTDGEKWGATTKGGTDPTLAAGGAVRTKLRSLTATAAYWRKRAVLAEAEVQRIKGNADA
jgi:hypothetical protein